MRSKLIPIFLLLCCAFPYVIIHALENPPGNIQLDSSEKELIYWIKVGYTFILIVGLINILSQYTNQLTQDNYETD